MVGIFLGFQEYAKRGAYAYVSMIQREERKNKVQGGSWVLRDGHKRGKQRQKLPTAELFFKEQMAL